MRPRKNYEKYYGYEAESDAIMEVKPEGRYNGQYLNYRDSLKKAAETQPDAWDPQDPPVAPFPLPSELHYLVQSEIQNQPELEEADIRFFTARGSHFDRLHGVDAFFTASLPGIQPVWATIDFTTNPDKDDYKADLIALFPPNFTDTEITKTKDREVVERSWADQIAALLAERLKNARPKNAA